ncbi:MAG: hypothetical protein GY838_19005 [bacterium]|nr:hypothetical protein [bacterium]
MTELLVAAVQTSPVFGEVRTNVDAALELVPADTDLAVLPELFSTGYQFRDRDEARSLAEDPAGDGYACRRLRAAARDLDTTLVAGIAETAGDKLYNSAVMIRPDGSRELYRKIHLFWDEKSIFEPGDLGFPVFRACGTTVGLMICFDWVFPEAARSLALAGAQILLHPANLLLPWCPEAMKTRSQENRVFTVTANRIGLEDRTDNPLRFIGMSQLTSPLGEVLERLDETTAGVATARLDPQEAVRTKTITPRNDVFGDRRPDQYRL